MSLKITDQRELLAFLRAADPPAIYLSIAAVGDGAGDASERQIARFDLPDPHIEERVLGALSELVQPGTTRRVRLRRYLHDGKKCELLVHATRPPEFVTTEPDLRVTRVGAAAAAETASSGASGPVDDRSVRRSVADSASAHATYVPQPRPMHYPSQPAEPMVPAALLHIAAMERAQLSQQLAQANAELRHRSEEVAGARERIRAIERERATTDARLDRITEDLRRESTEHRELKILAERIAQELIDKRAEIDERDAYDEHFTSELDAMEKEASEEGFFGRLFR